MPSMSRRVRQKVIAAAAVAVLLAGGALAAVSATGQSSTPTAHRARRGSVARELAVAADYLSISRAQLSSELSAGKTLAQLAEASSGKSKQGLVEALEAARKAKLSTASAKLDERVGREVNRVGGPGGNPRGAGGASAGQTRLKALFATAHSPGTVAAGYLGVPSSQLQSGLRSGKTLAQLADASAGKSEAGLVDALLAAKQQRFDKAVAAGRLSDKRRAKRLARLRQRTARLVQRRFAGAGSRG
jgi:cellobiose-specific phosphotransferase system component IIA